MLIFDKLYFKHWTNEGKFMKKPKDMAKHLEILQF